MSASISSVSTPSSTGSGTLPPILQQRLDLIDRALIGVLPRNQRLELVERIEQAIEMLGVHESIQGLAAANSGVELAATAPIAISHPGSGRHRSRLAVLSGVGGLVAMALLFVSPIIYVLVCGFASLMGEELSLAILALHLIAMSIGGVAAVSLGLVALLRLGHANRRSGHGWAITGLCAGPMPALFGVLVLAVVGNQWLQEGTTVAPAIYSSQSLRQDIDPLSNVDIAIKPAAPLPTVQMTPAMPSEIVEKPQLGAKP